jgi:hypothetical protein
MGTIRDMAERHWEGGGDLVFDEHPVRPTADRQAEEIAETGRSSSTVEGWAGPTSGAQSSARSRAPASP